MPPRGRLLLHRRHMSRNPLEGLALTLGRLPAQKEAWQYLGGPRAAARAALAELRALRPDLPRHAKDTTPRAAEPIITPDPTATQPGGINWDRDESARWEKSETESRLYVRPRDEARVDVAALIEGVIDRKLAGVAFPQVFIRPAQEAAQLVTGTFDLHLGKRDVDGKWSVEAAKRHALAAIQDIDDQAGDLTRTQRTILIVGNDAVHTATGWTSTKGTLQHATVQTGAEVEALIDLTCTQIELFAQRGPVHLLGVSGNHGRDPETAALYGIRALITRGVFGKHVTVGEIAGNRPITSDYWAEGGVLTFCRHGDDINLGKPELLALEMARHPDWTAATFRDYHLGHTHTLARKGVRHHSGMGFEIVVHPALGGADEWHERHSFVGAARSAVGVLYRGHRRTLLESFRLGGYGAGEGK